MGSYFRTRGLESCRGGDSIAIGSVPLVIKIGHVPETHRAVQLVEALDGVVDGLSMTNSLRKS